MFVARVIPSAMMFVPSIGGRSHDISENTSDFGYRVWLPGLCRSGRPGAEKSASICGEMKGH